MMDVDFTNLPKESSVRPIASNGEPHHVQATLFTDKSTIAAGETLRLGIHLEQDEGWHTYWKSPEILVDPLSSHGPLKIKTALNLMI